MSAQTLADDLRPLPLDLIPLRHRDKRPRDRDWTTRAYSREEVEAWRRAGGNVGARLRPGDLVVDVDLRNLAEGESLEGVLLDLELLLGDAWDAAPLVRTGGGGLHAYLRLPEGVRLVERAKWLSPAVELKQVGRQVVAPGSIHPNGNRYEWIRRPSDGPAPIVPADAVERLRRPEAPASAGPGVVGLERAVACLHQLRAEDFRDHGRWLELMQAVHAATGGGVEARELFVEWSTADPEYSDHADLIRPRWDSLRADRAGGVTAATLFRRVVEAGGAVPHAPAEEDFDAVEGGGEPPKPKGKPTKPRRAIALCDALGVELWTEPGADGRTWASVRRDEHREHYPLRSRAFRRWLAAAYYTKHGDGFGARAFEEAADVLEGRLLAGPARTRPTALRVAREPESGDLLIDTGWPGWEVIRVSGGRWRVESNAGLPVAFRRPGGLGALARPAAPGTGSLDPLRELLNVEGERDWVYVVAYMLGCLWPDGPYPVLVLTGRHGAAKSTGALLVRQVVDPHVLGHRRLPKDVDSFNTGARNQHVLAFDNVSRIEDWQSDCLARLSTGAGDASRKFYDQDEDVLYTARRPVLLNAISNPVRRPDLLDRALHARLAAIPDGRRLTEAGVLRRFEQAAPLALGALLDATAAAQATYLQVQPGELPRLADFARWVTAAEAALPWSPNTFLAHYREDRGAASRDLLDDDAVGAALLRLLAERGGAVDAEPADLHRDLARASMATGRVNLPDHVRGTRTALERLAPELERAGVRVDLDARAHGGRRRWRITRSGGADAVDFDHDPLFN